MGNFFIRLLGSISFGFPCERRLLTGSLGIMGLHMYGHLCWLAWQCTWCRVLANSKLFHEAEAGTYLPNNTKSINGINVPLLILGDPDYPMLPWLMKPYADTGRLTPKQLRFNYRLSRARMVVRSASGRLKGLTTWWGVVVSEVGAVVVRPASLGVEVAVMSDTSYGVDSLALDGLVCGSSSLQVGDSTRGLGESGVEARVLLLSPGSVVLVSLLLAGYTELSRSVV